MDKLLLTDTNYCCLDEQPASDRRVNVDGLKYNDGRNKHHEKVGQHENYLLQRIIDSLTWNVVVLHHKTGRDDDACPVTKEVGTNRLESVFGCQQLHPVCKNYRTLRTHLRAQRIILPWNWYYRTEFKLSGLALHALTEDIRFVINKTDYTTWRIGTIVWRFVQNSLAPYDAAQIDVTSSSKESASLHIDSADFTFKSWRYPVVSAHLDQITINIIIQKDENRFDDKLLVGDMKIPELLRILPKPPELEGLYPRIGLIKITNVTLCVYEGRGRSESSLNLLMKVTLPDKLFSPVTNLTLANSPSGIDRKHFQSLLESAFSHSIRQHLLREAEKAFHNSLTSTTEFTKQLKDRTNRVQEQIHQYLLKRQDMHFDPILTAVGAWIEAVKQTPPLVLLVSHLWTKLVAEINKNVVSIDQHVWRHVNDLELAFDGLVAKTTGKDVDHEKYKSPIEKRITNRMDKLKYSFVDLVAKSGGNIERSSCIQ